MARKKSLSGESCSSPAEPASGQDTAVQTFSADTPSIRRPCFIIGLGASAGAQAALEQIFTLLPPDCGLSFVVIMHIPLAGPSFLAEMLGRYATMPVVTAEDGMALLPDRVQVIPAGHGLILRDGVLRLEESELRGVRHPVDRFFETLATEARHHAIAVLLSGTGTDGAKGVKAIKEAGGTVIVQEPESALYPDMPRHAIATGTAEYVLPAEAIAAKIAEIAGKTCPINPPACQVMSFDEELAAIFASVKSRTGHDFSAYKKNTVLRRIERRMAVHEVSGIRKYVSLLKETPWEASALAQDILIGVTGFFRDPEAFATIEREIIPRLFADRHPEEPVRIWHACCATGEEVYSMAFLIREYLDRQGSNAKVQIFATDIDEIAIAQARAGLYPEGIEDEVGEERLKAFFVRSDKRWQVVKAVREMIVFAHHSVIKNPPFSRLDLLVCRNFLIYLNPDMQNRLIAMFHQVLKPGKFLFLGSSETVGRNTELFALLDKKWKVFERTTGKRRNDALFPFSTPVRYLPGAMPSPKLAEAVERGPAAVAERLLFERYSPPCVIVNGKYEIVHVTSRMNRFLEIPPGEPSRDILRMAREELRPALRAAIHKAFAENSRVEFRGLKVDVDGAESAVNLLVEPLEEAHATGKLAMVIFETVSSPARAAVPSGGDATTSGDEASAAMLVRQLEEQLRITHEQLQATTEQLESSNEGFLSANEELISMNEEFQSANEELQSTNEELETSKEELQVLNEELVTVNAELQGKVEELNEATSDMENLLASSGIATLFLDRELHIKGFTPAAAAIFNLIPADIGRPFRHLAGKIDWSTLTHDSETVLVGQPFTEVEITTLKAGQCYLKRIFPYRTQEGSVDGIVVSYIDITKRKEAEAALAESEKRVRHKLESIISPEGDIGNLDLADIIDAPSLQALVDDFYQLTGMPMGLIDLKGNILVGVGWQDACTKFHRVNADTLQNCVESDVRLSAGVPQGEYKIYKCKNHMWDVATPVMVGDQHFGNLFMGQFFFEDEPVDYELFRAQAKEYGFDEQAYLAALEAVPRLNRETLNTSMNFFMKLADLLSMLSYSNLKLARSLSEREALMASLRESELFYRQTLESIPGMVFTTRPDGYCDYQSQQWVDFTGVPMVEHLGNGWNKLLHPDDRPRAYSAWREAVEERAPYDLEYRIRRHDGAYEWFKVRGRPIRDAAGEIVRWFGTALNIDHLIKAEEELRQAKEEWELTFNSVPDLIAILNDQHRVVRVNRAMAERLGREPEEYVGMFCHEAVHGSNLPPDFCPHSRTMSDGGEHNVELHEERLGGDFLVSTTPLLNRQGQMTGTVHVARDITERKQVEKELRRAKEAAEAATQAKSQFLANMSHELRTPMTGVLGMLELTLGTSLEDRQREYLGIAQSSAHSLLHILNDILDLAKIEAGKVSINLEPFILSVCVATATDLLLPEARRKALQLDYVMAENLPEIVIGDQIRLKQVLINLIGNAVKFSEKGAVAVRVAAGRTTADGPWEYTFSVTDSGIGIPQEKHHLLFEHFSQVDDSHTRRFGGTGLGLVISKKLVELMGGTVSFVSEAGVGSTFTFTLPLRVVGAESNAPATIFPDDARETPPPVPQKKKKPRLLIAEDDAIIREVLDVMFRSARYDIDFAEEGQQAVEMWEKGEYELVLMDIQMPELNGFEVTRIIREKERERGGHTPIVAMTAHAFKEDVERCLAAGMDAYLSKPIDLKKSLQLIEEILDRSSALAE